MRTTAYYLIVLVFCCFACKKKKDEVDPKKGGPDTEIRSTTPCDINLASVEANSTLTIDCLLDLKGETIILPQSVSFEFAGGDIVNGTLKFAGGRIDGRLLSSKLTIEGDVALKDPTFEFIPSRWDIVEGETTSDIAFKNNAELERIMFFTKKLGATTFNIDKFDAYFEVYKVTSTATNANFYPSLEAINIPSDFNLVMSDNTHLRIFPGRAGDINGTILAVRDVDNVTVTGGNLHGDRDQRAYLGNNGQEGSHLFHIHSGRNITLDGIKFFEGSAGGITIYSFGFSFNPATYKPTKDVVIKNCTFKDIRRMSMSITDGRSILVENNTFINTGLPSDKTDGGEVGYAINIEATRTRDASGNLKEYQKAFDITIKGNTEKGSRSGAVSVHIGQNVTIENNTLESRVVYTYASGTKITGNKFRPSENSAKRFAIFATGDGETVFNNEISHNDILGYSLGIAIGSKDVYVHDNVIKDCGIGLQLSKASDARIYNNTIVTSLRGISASNTFNNNIDIQGNEITSDGFHLYFAQLNNETAHKDYKITLEKNKFFNAKQVSFSNAYGITFKNNEVDGGLGIGNVTNVEISDNIIKPNESDGIRLFKTHSGVSIMNNVISEPTGASRYMCINNKSESPQSITMTGNTCN